MSEENIQLILDNLTDIKEHLKTLNGQVAKHSDWVNRYDIRVANEIPEQAKKISDINKKIFVFTGVLAGINIFGFIAFFSMIKNLIK